MEDIEITNIELLNTNELSVKPAVNWNNSFQFIYRTATGVIWNEKTQCFMSPIPKEWSHLDWYANIVTSVLSEMGVNLIITPNTNWLNMPEDLQNEITNYVPENNT
jgi:hypothetical protein